MSQNRREFLENSLFAATAATLATTPLQSFAEDKVSDSANERLNVAVLGVRGRGNSHIGAFTNTRKYNTAVTVVCDPDRNIGEAKAADITKKTGVPCRYVQDLRKVMEDPSIDIVTIATPNHWHSLAGIWAVQNGKDVYCEKPVSHNVSEGRRLVQAARKAGKIVQTGTQCRSMGGTKQAIEFVHGGGIGEVNLARGLCYKPRGSINPAGKYDVPKNINYNVWLGPAPAIDYVPRKRFHYDWHWQWDYGNGDLGNQGIHQMDIARWGLKVNDVGKGVLSFGGRVGYIDAGQTANTQVSIHDYGEKKLVFEVRGLRTPSVMGSRIGVIFYGSDGYVVLTKYTGGAAYDKDRKKIKTFNAGGDHFGNFLKAVRSRKHTDLAADIEEGHLSSALCHLGNISYRMGSKIGLPALKDRLQSDKIATKSYAAFADHLGANNVDFDKTPIALGANLKLDGKTEKFVGTAADKANTQLSREYRKGFEVPDKI